MSYRLVVVAMTRVDWALSVATGAAVVGAAGVADGVLVHPAMRADTNRTAMISAIDPIYTLFLII
ncbi:MAG: hypothetical protein A4E42_01457 [Methanoregulaceae archaeon PtaU1.Bin222]|nr:MAG: hypothetical protein A4E42_01457 [Methanoregulaceae archaeon PtaU1.Bin222]